MQELYVLMPIYKSNTEWLQQALISIKNQQVKNLYINVVCVFDGVMSAEESKIIRSKFYDASNPCFSITSLKLSANSGVAVALNYGIHYIKYKNPDYVARLDSDDIWCPNKIQTQIEFMDKNNVDICGSWAHRMDCYNNIIDGNWKYCKYDSFGNLLTADTIKQQLINCGNCLVHPSIIMNKHALVDYYYNPVCNGFEDYELWLRMLMRGYKIDVCPQPLLHYRNHTGQVTNSKDYVKTCVNSLHEVRNLYKGKIK